MSTRTEKVSKLLQREISQIFQYTTKDFHKGVMITVTKVRVSTDLSVAKIYLSIFPSNKTDEIIATIDENKNGKIRKERTFLAQGRIIQGIIW